MKDEKRPPPWLEVNSGVTRRTVDAGGNRIELETPLETFDRPVSDTDAADRVWDRPDRLPRFGSTSRTTATIRSISN